MVWTKTIVKRVKNSFNNNKKALGTIAFMFLLAYVLDTRLFGYTLVGFAVFIFGFAAYRIVFGWQEYKRIVNFGADQLEIVFGKRGRKVKKVKTKVKK